MADQFRNGKNVHAGNLAYLQRFSAASNASYEWLMNEVADMYGVVPRDAVGETPMTTRTVATLGRFALANAY